MFLHDFYGEVEKSKKNLIFIILGDFSHLPQSSSSLPGGRYSNKQTNSQTLEKVKFPPKNFPALQIRNAMS